MSKLKAEALFEKFKQIADPRQEHLKDHLLFDILVISVCATICGAEHWTEFEEFGEAKQEWFASFLSLKNGISSHDTFQQVFILLDNIKLKEVFIEWVSEVVSLSGGVLVNIDGKKLRASKEPIKGKQALNIVSAWVSAQSVVLGQVACEEKSNEIMAIPELLKILDLEGCVVTIDAMGCQKEIVKQIVEKKADYVIALKENQGHLYRGIKDYLDWGEKIEFKEIKFDYYETEWEKDHGRIEQ